MSVHFFPGFEDAWYETTGGRLHAVTGGPRGAEALLFLHGFPESHSSWHTVAPSFAGEYRVVVLDMKGYGYSDAPVGDNGKRAYTKRTIAAECMEVMRLEGYSSFTVIGHDRGAQVAYRLAFDYPDAITRLAILDNLPIFAVWDIINSTPGAVEHWNFLARQGVRAEQEITVEWLEDLIRAHIPEGTLRSFDPRVLKEYREMWTNPANLHAFAEDYRAGARTDLDDDIVDRDGGRTITCPSVVIWGRDFFGRFLESPLDVWRTTFTPNAFGVDIAGGHYMMAENPTEVIAGVRRLLAL